MEILNEQSISNIECLLEYKNYRALTVKQCDEILILCDVLRPSLFNNKLNAYLQMHKSVEISPIDFSKWKKLKSHWPFRTK